MEYKMHVSDQSETPDHCCLYELSDERGAFSALCNHSHDRSCTNCEGLQRALESIEDALMSDKVKFESDDQKDELLYTFKQGRKTIEEWKKHILRTVNQDRARNQILNDLSEDEVFLERDWAMKFLPMLYRESQSKWFAKRGINWHICVGSFKQDGDISTHTFVHLFDHATQDATTSNAVLLDILGRLHTLNPKLRKAFIRSDNAGCFHGYTSIFGVKAINKESSIAVSRVDFADPQSGKSICDRRAARLKAAIRKHVNEGNDVRTAADFLGAIKSSHVLTKSLIVCASPPKSICLKLLRKCPLQNITQFYNFLFKSGGIDVLKQFGVGEGQFVPFSSCFSEGNEIQQISVLEVFTSECRSNSLTMARIIPVVESTEEMRTQKEEEDDDQAISSNGLFFMSGGELQETFSYYGNLMHHLDIGSHVAHRNSSCLSNRAKLSYSSKIETKCSKKPQTTTQQHAANSTSLQRGWALKSKCEVKRFTEQQRDFLTAKFNVGERSGLKCDPEDVAVEMRSMKDKSGKRLFPIDDFLSASQIASFFSRLCIQKRKRNAEILEEEDIEAEEFEANFSSLVALAKQ